jgi:sugar-specific transcriptional regulator TrmB
LSTKTVSIADSRILSRLKELGLSSYEALAFVTLLSRSSMTANALCRETGIPDSKIYYALDGLAKRGMITVQKGNPNIFRPVQPRDAIANLKEEMTEELNERTREADSLADLLTSIYDSAEKPQELELAYIIRGQKNIMKRMKALIDTARKEVTIFISHPEVYTELEDCLARAGEERRVTTNIAVTREIYEKTRSTVLRKSRYVCCTDLTSADSPGMLITDTKTLLTIANWIDETAILTQDPNIVRVCRSYFDNPAWCKKMS